MPRGVGHESGCGPPGRRLRSDRHSRNLAEINHPHRYATRCCSAELVGRKTCPALSLVVWTLKREISEWGNPPIRLISTVRVTSRTGLGGNRGERPIKPGNSWFSAKTIEVVPRMDTVGGRALDG
ncbi:hypothetical protein FH972_027187 [Carpinus fangiana]|uniref:Uncharacterized protein n=1 Tax=Carpinus fangiana TaxID=176857 RepID=A0A5N6L8P8_9ROSI|nr:hypothetical protein FH972_027187 [Carpinus fangiana]